MPNSLSLRQQTFLSIVTFCYICLCLSDPEARAQETFSLRTLAHRFAPVLIHDSREISPLTSVEAQQKLGWQQTSEFIDLQGRIATTSPAAYYAGTVAGRYLYLQYWFFYSWNDTRHFGVLEPCTRHEGDWEHIGLRLDRLDNFRLTDAYYAAHKRGFRGETKHLTPSQLRYVEKRPVVYVSRGSHASYPAPGTYPLAQILGYTFQDVNDGQGLRVDTQPHLLPLRQQSWFHYAGRWGVSRWGPCDLLKVLTPLSNDGPTGPGFGDKVRVLQQGDWYDAKRP